MKRSKVKAKGIVSIILVVAALVASIAGISAIVKPDADDGFDIVNVTFAQGGLDENGAYEETKASIYTTSAFECEENVRIKPVFTSNVTYKVYFYDESDAFVSASEEYSTTETVEVPEGATTARIEINPIWDEDVKEDDQIIRVWEVLKYAKQITVMVAS